MNKQWLTPEGAFKSIALAQQKEMEESVLVEYKEAEIAARESELKSIVDKGESTDEQVKALKEQVQSLKDLNYEGLRGQMKAMSETVAGLKKKGVKADSGTFKSELKSAWDNNLEKIKSMGSGSAIDMEIKATQTYGDINAGSDFAQMRAGVFEQPVRRVVIKDLFDTIPVSTEFYKYTEVNTVVRDAQNVAKCAPVTSTTKESLVVRSIETKVIKDIMDFCTQFVADYKFMASRIRKLITQSVALRVDRQLLLGTGLLEQTFSIDSVSSVFDAANVACPLAAGVEKATMVDLILGMQTQIDVLGQEADFMADTVIVNRCDWFLQVESRKNVDGNYLDARVAYVNGVPFIGAMRVITTPIVAVDSLYVFDSTKGEIVDRGLANVSISFENRDNWEKDIGSIKAYERLNFLVANNNANAFMKTLTVAASIVAINK